VPGPCLSDPWSLVPVILIPVSLTTSHYSLTTAFMSHWNAWEAKTKAAKKRRRLPSRSRNQSPAGARSSLRRLRNNEALPAREGFLNGRDKMTKRQRIQAARLTEATAEFNALLPRCLRECAAGRWGLFGQNDYLDPDQRYCPWPEARRLRTIALEIRSAGIDFGQTQIACERFLQLCSLRGPNVPGEPKLAAALLAELESTSTTECKTAAPFGAAVRSNHD